MPTSDGQGKNIALAWFNLVQPRTVVDVGAGCGTYAKLMRPFDTPGTHWTAVEAWEPYVEEFGLTRLYDKVIVADVRQLPWTDLRADLIIAGDVLEHMSAADARMVLERARHAARYVIVSVPVLHLDQGAVNGNPYECHVDHWSAASMSAELRSWGRVIEQWVGDVLAYFLWTGETND